jgi:DNA-binding CsgD family transcriptional regulator/tetratricopeptide (TPR) repeat protein
MDLQLRGAQLIGRERECRELDQVLQRVTGGQSGSLVLRGDPGMGKTTLLDYAVERADGMTVLRATGVQAEADLAFAGLFGLLRPILGLRSALPDTQATALGGALGLAPSPGDNRFLVAAAVLGLLAAAGDERPVLCVIDDAQWLDVPSADALVFAARRLYADRVAMIFAAREGEAQRFEAQGLPELTLQGLDQGAAHTLIAMAAPGSTDAVRERLLAEANGNPLALTQLPGALTDAMLQGTEPLPEAIPLTPRLQALYRRQVEELPGAGRLALLIAAADDTGELSTVVRAVEQLDLPADALDPAESAGLVRILGGTMAFRHPLVRAAVYEAATISQRQRAHMALARVLVGEEQVDRRVWHQAMATLTADEEVATALETSARRSERRAAHASAATAFLRAAELSTDERRRERRIAAAAQAAWAAGQVERSREAIARLLPGADGELRARLLHLSGMIDVNTGSLREACAKLREGAGLSSDPELTLEMLLEAVEAASFTGEAATVTELAKRGAAVDASGPRARMMVKLLAGFAKAYGVEQDWTGDVLAEALEQANALTDPRVLVWASTAASVAGNMGDGLEYATRAVEAARRQGLLSVLPMALQRQSGELLRRSRFDEAYAAAVDAHRLGLDLGYAPAWCVLAMSSVEAMWGRDNEAWAHAEEALTIGERTGETFLSSSARYTFAFIDLSRGRWAQATERLLELVGPSRSATHPFLVRAALPDLVEAAVRAGRADTLAPTLESFRQRIETSPTAAGSAMLARSEAVVDPSPERFDDALAQAQALSPFQRARTELLCGEWLRRERRRQDARVHLRSALETFRSLGTSAWADRAESELRATGETVRKRSPETLDHLTPQELQIAGLVAEGLTNRDIAGQLYISPRTVDYHLRKVFTKLGISSRAELIRRGAPQPA